MIFKYDNNSQNNEKIKLTSFGRFQPFFIKNNNIRQKEESRIIKLTFKKNPKYDYIRIFSNRFFMANKNRYILIINNKKLNSNYPILIIPDSSDIVKSKLVILIDMRSIEYMFFNCSTLLSLSGFSNFKLCNIEKMKYMFAHCSLLEKIENSFIEIEKKKLEESFFNNNNSLQELNDDSLYNSINFASELLGNEMSTLSMIKKESTVTDINIEYINAYNTEKVKDLSNFFLNVFRL